MAGIEKVCEYSGEYQGVAMYWYKRNLIQVMPKYRKLFRGKQHTLHIFKPEKLFLDKWGSMSYNPKEMDSYTPPFKTIEEWENHYKAIFGMRVGYSWNYYLEVPDVQGNVQGMYYNWTTDLKTVKRKLKRLLRTKQLTIVYHDCTMYEHYQQQRNKQ